MSHSFSELRSAMIRCQTLLSPSRYSYKLTLQSGIKNRSNHLRFATINFTNNTINVWANKTLWFQVIGEPGFKNFHIVFNDGRIMAAGVYEMLQNPAESEETLRFSVFKHDERSQPQNIATLHRDRTDRIAIVIKNEFCPIGDDTAVMLIGKMLAMAVHEPFLTKEERQKDYFKEFLLPEVQPLLDLELSKISLKKIATIQGASNQYYVILDEYERPMYVCNLDRSTSKLTLFKAYNFTPILTAADALLQDFKIHTSRGTCIGYCKGMSFYDVRDANILTIGVEHSTLKITNSKDDLVCSILKDPYDNLINMEFFYEPESLTTAFLLPFFCIVGAESYNLKDINVPDLSNCESLMDILKKEDPSGNGEFSHHVV